MKVHFDVNQGCYKSGVYGEKCSNLCPTNCEDNTCHIQNGTCYVCKPGWTGSTCNTSNTCILDNYYVHLLCILFNIKLWWLLLSIKILIAKLSSFILKFFIISMQKKMVRRQLQPTVFRTLQKQHSMLSRDWSVW